MRANETNIRKNMTVTHNRNSTQFDYDGLRMIATPTVTGFRVQIYVGYGARKPQSTHTVRGSNGITAMTNEFVDLVKQYSE